MNAKTASPGLNADTRTRPPRRRRRAPRAEHRVLGRVKPITSRPSGPNPGGRLIDRRRQSAELTVVARTFHQDLVGSRLRNRPLQKSSTSAHRTPLQTTALIAKGLLAPQLELSAACRARRRSASLSLHGRRLRLARCRIQARDVRFEPRAFVVASLARRSRGGLIRLGRGRCRQPRALRSGLVAEQHLLLERQALGNLDDAVDRRLPRAAVRGRPEQAAAVDLARTE
ncbi:MAG: hypothetical protein IPP50_13940 [Piscinibacter sp.]|nr:hypothetical protein [Piscinibacter sp.]